MTIEELKKDKKELERSILNNIASHVEEFYRKTGLSVKDVNVCFINGEVIDGKEYYHLHEVQTEVSI